MNYRTMYSEPFYCNDSTTVDDVIDHVLVLLNTSFAGGCVELSNFCHRNNGKHLDSILVMNVRAKMYVHDVATVCQLTGISDTEVKLTPKGSHFAKKGSWKAYLVSLQQEQFQRELEKADEQKRQLEAHRASLTNASAAIDSAKAAKSSAKAAWFAAAFTAVPILWGVYQYFDSQSKQNEINALKSELQSLTSQLRARKPNRIDSISRIDSLPAVKKLKK